MFKREERYIVIKRKNINHVTEECLREYLKNCDIRPIECVVVEPHWPIFDVVWAMIENTANTQKTRLQRRGQNE